ncbi:MAG TPA: hypothetical protein VFE16_10295 [Candidatus Cybelea sp.]|jgi:hypothetical protein|nr:hypothetical protein [Candidatus Cybelea sp.]
MISDFEKVGQDAAEKQWVYQDLPHRLTGRVKTFSQVRGVGPTRDRGLTRAYSGSSLKLESLSARAHFFLTHAIGTASFSVSKCNFSGFGEPVELV